MIYKNLRGFDLFTNFSKKIILNKENISPFLNKKNNRRKYKSTDLFIGFFGYELLNNLIGIKIPKQKSINFPKGIFYNPEKKISFTNNLNYKKNSNTKPKNNFTININKKSYTKIFNKFKKKIKSGETYQIKICTKYKTGSKIDPLDFFCRLSKTNLAPEAFMIRDKNYSIISCSPENLITKQGSLITTKPIAGTVKKNKSMTKKKALKYFKKNLKETKEHNMIVDMERNDLSRICKIGTVKLSRTKIIEEYKDLFHYVSLVKGKLKKNIKETKEHNMIVDMERNDLSKICKVGTVKLSRIKIVEEYKDLFHYVSLVKGKIKKKHIIFRNYKSYDAWRFSNRLS